MTMANEGIIIDAGPLVAFVDRSDRYHEWVAKQIRELHPPFICCEAVLTETLFLLRGVHGGNSAIFKLLARGLLRFPLQFESKLPRIMELMQRYDSVPMSLADACIVCIAEQNENSTVLTLDSDFRVYRKQGKLHIPVIMP